ncbi:hypothetical protein ACQP1G_45400 [Nocardia sp. CA-107356]|uniref:hypothetical protein n=1 Tax=Nocardia sp. CA-107356 TaxID=3239972 RepID=UPI003D8E9368
MPYRRFVAHIGQKIDSTVAAINAGPQSQKAGRVRVSKVAVIVDRDLARGPADDVGSPHDDS